MPQRHRYNSVRFGAAIVGVLTAVMASFLALIAGGFGVGTVAAFLVGPILVGVLWGLRAAFGAFLSAGAGLIGLVVLQVYGFLSPALVGQVPLAIAALLLMLGIYATSVVVRLLRAASSPALKSNRVDTASSPLDAALPSEWLIIEVSPLGRIRHRRGNPELLSAAQPGRLAQDVLVDATQVGLTAGRHKIGEGEEIFVDRTVTPDGEVFLVLPAAILPVDQNEAVEQKLRDRTDFFAGLGHDLKSPLNAVIGFADLMGEEVRGPLPEAYQDYPGLIKESGQTLLRLVEDMLGYARSEAGTLEIEPAPIDVAASAKAVLRQSQADAERRGVKLVLKSAAETLAMADAGAVQRIWDNLVSNAIKYSHEGGTVTLAIQKRPNHIVLSVSDRGIGMDSEDLARIATPFEQGRNARGKAGTGLGLAMVKRLAELHGGKMMIRTAPGEGTQITVALPRANERDRHAAE